MNSVWCANTTSAPFNIDTAQVNTGEAVLHYSTLPLSVGAVYCIRHIYML